MSNNLDMKKPIAIVAAMQEELDALLTRFTVGDVKDHFNIRLYHARHLGHEIVIAQSGVGKVNAACTLALLLSDFGPGCVINTGSAGGLQQGQRILDLVAPAEIVYTDVDVTPLGFAYGQILGCEPRFYATPTLLALLRKVLQRHPTPPVCHHGLLGSADSFIHQPEQLAQIRKNFPDGVACVDMEGGAIAHVCTRFGVPFIILRALSDVPGAGNNALDFKTFLAQAAERSADLCLALVEELAKQ